MIRALTLLALAASPSPAPAAPPPPVLAAPRVTVETETARLDLAISPGTLFEERADSKEWRLFLPGLQPPAVLPKLDGFVLNGLTARAEAGGTTLVVPWRHWCPTELTWQPGDQGLTVTFKTVYREVDEEALAAGVTHMHVRQADHGVPQNIHVLKVDPRIPGVRLAPAMAGTGTIFSRSTVSELTRRFGAVAGVNGSYFSPKTGEPLGVLMINGELISGPLFNRTALAIGDNGALSIGNTQLSYRVSLPGGEAYDVDGINQARGLNRMVLFTSHYGVSTFTPAGGREFSLLPDGTVFAIQENNTPIPPGGMVLSAHGQAAQWLDAHARVGTRLDIHCPLNEFWPGVKHIVGGGPTLVRDGELALTTDQEQFKPDIAQGYAPRTAVGMAADGQVMLVTVDGRLPGLSRGLTLTGLATLMQSLGATDALNLDGGGSTAMAIGPTTVNRPSDGAERPVNNALLVFGPTLVGAARP